MLFNKGTLFIGLLFVAMALASFFLTKEYIACQIYKDRLVAFDPNDQNKIRIIMFDDIISYELDTKGSTYVAIAIKTGPDPIMDFEEVAIRTFKASALRSKLFKLIPKKDSASIKMESLNANRLTNKEAKAAKAAYKERKALEKARKNELK